MHLRQFFFLSIFAIATVALPQLETATPTETSVVTPSTSSNLDALISQLNLLNNPAVDSIPGTSPVAAPQATAASGPSVPPGLASAPPKFAANNTAQALSSPMSALPATSTPLISANAPAFAAVPSPGSSASDFSQTILSNLFTAFIELVTGGSSSSSSSNPLSFIFRDTSQDSPVGRRKEASQGESTRARRDLAASQTYALGQLSTYFANLIYKILATTPSTESKELMSAASEGLARDPVMGIQLVYQSFRRAFPDAKRAQLDAMMRSFIDTISAPSDLGQEQAFAPLKPSTTGRAWNVASSTISRD